MSAVRLPAEWEIVDDVAIIDPDGWDRRNYDESWNTPIDYEEWKVRMWRSTIASGLRQWKAVDEDLAARIRAEEGLK
jgi:hypothetical protein